VKTPLRGQTNVGSPREGQRIVTPKRPPNCRRNPTEGNDPPYRNLTVGIKTPRVSKGQLEKIANKTGEKKRWFPVEEFPGQEGTYPRTSWKAAQLFREIGRRIMINKRREKKRKERLPRTET